MDIELKLFMFFKKYGPPDQVDGRSRMQVAPGTRFVDVLKKIGMPVEEDKIIVINGKVNEIRYSQVLGRLPLNTGEMRSFHEIVGARADEIVSKWIDFFVLHKPVKPERITRRLK